MVALAILAWSLLILFIYSALSGLVYLSNELSH